MIYYLPIEPPIEPEKNPPAHPEHELDPFEDEQKFDCELSKLILDLEGNPILPSLLQVSTSCFVDLF